MLELPIALYARLKEFAQRDKRTIKVTVIRALEEFLQTHTPQEDTDISPGLQHAAQAAQDGATAEGANLATLSSKSQSTLPLNAAKLPRTAGSAERIRTIEGLDRKEHDAFRAYLRSQHPDLCPLLEELYKGTHFRDILAGKSDDQHGALVDQYSLLRNVLASFFRTG
jgi:hypothetical protein